MGENDLRVQMARLEERMNTMQAEYKTDIALLAEQLAEREARLAERDARLAERDARLAERDARLAEQRTERDARLEKELAAVRTEAAQRETALVDRMTVRVGIGVAILGAILAAIRYLP